MIRRRWRRRLHQAFSIVVSVSLLLQTNPVLASPGQRTGEPSREYALQAPARPVQQQPQPFAIPEPRSPAAQAQAAPLVCDVDGDGIVASEDISAIFAARKTQADPGDPRDADGNGEITVNDGRFCVLQCTFPNCAAATPVVLIEVTPVDALFLVGETQAFTAIGVLTDGTRADLTGQVTWASSAPTVATITGAGEATGVTGGATTISATTAGITGSTTLSIEERVSDTSLPTAAITTPLTTAIRFA